jgi:hypothetical protein
MKTFTLVLVALLNGHLDMEVFDHPYQSHEQCARDAALFLVGPITRIDTFCMDTDLARQRIIAK